MFQKVTLALTVVFVLGAGSALPQEVGTRSGFWLSFGGGGGLMDGLRGAATYVRMGGTPNSRVQFGGQVLNWWRHDETGEHSRVSIAATAAVFPIQGGSPNRALLSEWFLRGGFGIVTAHSSSGVGPTLGTGIDLRLGRNFFVTPNVDLLVYFFRDETDVSLTFTLGLTWH
ncbi:MAG: hypothetical protein GTO22_25695 [Gemmatimonadales bacterium]|nr:hypothetical protein [Gemmatimonadales bacterium]